MVFEILGQSDGRVTYGPSPNNFTAAVCAWAGSEAERRYGNSESEPSPSDWADIQRTSKIERARRQAENIVSKFWKPIQKFSDVLLERANLDGFASLDGFEVRKICQEILAGSSNELPQTVNA